MLFALRSAAVGPEAVREHLVPATPEAWDAACRAAGTTPEALQSAVTAAFAR